MFVFVGVNFVSVGVGVNFVSVFVFVFVGVSFVLVGVGLSFVFVAVLVFVGVRIVPVGLAFVWVGVATVGVRQTPFMSRWQSSLITPPGALATSLKVQPTGGIQTAGWLNVPAKHGWTEIVGSVLQNPDTVQGHSQPLLGWSQYIQSIYSHVPV